LRTCEGAFPIACAPTVSQAGATRLLRIALLAKKRAVRPADRRSEDSRVRCRWAHNPLLIEYHDKEWGVPLHDDRQLFELLILEGAQAGLSWETILKKRENYRRAFDRFDPEKIASYDRRKVSELLANPGIVRNRLKIAATIANAQAFLAVQKELGGFNSWIWQFVGSEPKVNFFRSLRRPPARTPESDAVSDGLKKRGFRFVGSTICYAFMQAAGMVNDHALDCFRRSEILSNR
jgi:DNA-3-methyladenine glycosylase I